MAIGYKKKYQKVPQGGVMVERHVAKVAYRAYIDSETLANEISNMSTASAADVALVLRALEDRVSYHLCRGDVVKLDTLGSFYPTIHARSVATEAELTPATITRTGILFRPAQRLHRAIRQAGVQLVDDRTFAADTHATHRKEKSHNN